MNILITGGAGFIGSHLAESLLQDKHEIMVLDDLSTGKIENISHLKKNKKFKFHEGNILDCKLVLKLVTSSDCIYHLAAAVGVKYVLEHPLDSLITNVRGTEIVIELASKFKKKIFLSSSSEIYGKNGDYPFKESGDRLLGSVTIPRWGYACSKTFDEFLAIAYHKCRKLPVVIGRLFNICGTRQSPNYGMVIPRFVKQALMNKPITVYGDGQQVRSFTYITDAIAAMKHLMSKPRAIGEIFNIGSTEFIAIADLAKKIKKLCKSNSKIVFIPYRQAYANDFEDMLFRVPDISKLEQFTGFRPKMKLDEMLKCILNEHRGS